MPRLMSVPLLSTLLGASLLAAAAGTNEPPKEPPDAKETPDTKEPGEPVLPPWTLRDWYRTSNLADVREGTITLDALQGRETWVAVFRRDPAYADPRLRAEFRVAPAGIGLRAVGLLFGSTNGQTFHALEITRDEAVLYRAEPGKARAVLARRGGLTRPDGVWQSASVECNGQIIRVFFRNELLFTAEERGLQPGLIGAYASQGRAEVRLDVAGRATRLSRPWQLRSP